MKYVKILQFRIDLQGVAALSFLVFFLIALSAIAAEQKAANPAASSEKSAPIYDSASVASEPEAIQIKDVAYQSAEVSHLLRNLADKLQPGAQIDTIIMSLPEAMIQADRAMSETITTLQRHPPLPVLQTKYQQWQHMQRTFSEWLMLLTKRSMEIHSNLNQLAFLQKTWEITLDAATGSKASENVLQRINETIAGIRTARKSLNEQLDLVVELQNRTGNELEKCKQVLDEIARIQRASLSNIFLRDSLPLWSSDLWAKKLHGLPENMRRNTSAYWDDVINYFKDPLNNMLLYGVILAVMLLLFLASRREICRLTAAGETFSDVVKVFRHPVAASLTVTLFIATSPYSFRLPITVRDTFHVLALLPMIILIRPLVSARMIPGLYALGLLFGIDAMREIFSGEELTGQVFLILESLTGMAVMIWFLKNLPQFIKGKTSSSRLRILQSGGVLVILVFISGFVAAATGYMGFARLMTPGIIAGGVLALTLYAFFLILIGIVAIAFRVWPIRGLRIIQHHRTQLERRLYIFLGWIAIIALIVRYLSYIGLLTPILNFGEAVLNTKLERGAFGISAGNILEFFITVLAAYLLSSFIRFVLREDVYPRLGTAQGKSYAVSSLLHYCILALGFTAAIAAMGVNLTKLTVLTGAFGIGIGFGLQSVVNNFVSGLILLFERPIQVGDTVEVGELLGRVRSIGIRASTVHTRQGADVIVPNSQLVSDRVTNWTLSDRLRRIDLPVGVSYSSVPQKVIKTLEAVAVAHPQILHNPAPVALFVGYGDSSINFELRAWTAEFDEWPQIRSALAVAVYDAVHAAGMTFPFPQREVRILKGSEEANSSPAGQ